MSDNKKYQAQVVIHLSVAVFCALFGAVYEKFSHFIYSYYMIYAFAIPLVCGALPYAILALRSTRTPNERAMRFWNSAIATFTVGSVFRGVLDLYGSTNKLSIVYPMAGGVLVVLTIVSLILGKKGKE